MDVADDETARKAIVAKILQWRQQEPARSTWREHHQVEIVGFHRQSVVMSQEQLLEHLSAPSKEQGIRPTDLQQPLAKVASNAESPLLGIVLLSDGQHNVEPPSSAGRRDWASRECRIFPVVIGKPSHRATWRILDGAGGLRKSSRTRRRRSRFVTVATGLPAQDLSVEMQFDGKPIAAGTSQRHQAHTGKDDVYTVAPGEDGHGRNARALTIRAASKKKEQGSVYAGQQL